MKYLQPCHRSLFRMPLTKHVNVMPIRDSWIPLHLHSIFKISGSVSASKKAWEGETKIDRINVQHHHHNSRIQLAFPQSQSKQSLTTQINKTFFRGWLEEDQCRKLLLLCTWITLALIAGGKRPSIGNAWCNVRPWWWMLRGGRQTWRWWIWGCFRMKTWPSTTN